MRVAGRYVEDPRTVTAPVVLLRSFADDTSDASTEKHKLSWITKMWLPLPSRDFEETVCESLKSVGTFVAVDEPDRPLPRLGALRLRLGPTWREELTELLLRARLIVVVVGTSRGVRWELEHVAQRHLAKTVFVFPPVSPHQHAGRWRTFEDVVASRGPLVPREYASGAAKQAIEETAAATSQPDGEGQGAPAASVGTSGSSPARRRAVVAALRDPTSWHVLGLPQNTTASTARVPFEIYGNALRTIVSDLIPSETER